MTLCDASALIALLSVRDQFHQRCVDILPDLETPLITTWPCLVEAMYMLGQDVGWRGQEALLHYVEEEILLLYPLSQEDIPEIHRLMAKYGDLPMDFADASLVLAAERLQTTRIFTLDSDFYIYRLHGRDPFTVVPALRKS